MRNSLFLMCLLCLASNGHAYANTDDTTGAAQANTPSSDIADIDRQLVLDALNIMNPVSPEDILTFREQEARREEAATRTPVAQIKNESRPLLLEPGKLSKPVILTPGYVGAIVFTDSSGAPWPIARAVLGNTTLFNLVNPAETESNDMQAGDSHILYVTPLREHANSNILVHLQNSKVPLIVQLVSAPSSASNREHDGIVNFIVNARGPNAVAPVFDKISPTISDTLMNLLDGISPAGANILDIHPKELDLQSWAKDKKIYIRSNFTLLWPPYISHVESADIHAYEFEYTPAFIISINGTPFTVKVIEQ